MPRTSKKKASKEEEPAAKRRLDLDPKTPPRSKPHHEEKAPVVDLTETPSKKRGVDTFFSPKSESAFVTPPKKAPRAREEPPTPNKRRKIEKKEEQYVPTYIHKNVEYKRKGETEDETLVAAFRLVEKHFVIPIDFENNRKYGPLSGSSFEQRAISAYSLGLLEPRTEESAKVAICSACAEEGHKRSACPQLV